jgi:hypothetical protein
MNGHGARKNPLSPVIRGSCVLAAVMLLGAASPAQCKPADFPEKGAVTAAPTRPIESSSPDPVQTGVLQAELGWSHTWLTQSASANSLSNLVKLGLWCNTEIRWNMASYTSASAGGTTVSGMGDNFIAGQYRLLRETSHRPSTAIGYTIKSATAGAGLGSGATDHAATLMLGKTVRGFTGIFNATYFAMGQPNGGSNAKGEWTVAISHLLKHRFAFTGEVYADSRLNAANDAYGNSTWVLTYIHNPRLVFDVGSSLALTSGAGAPGNAIFGGVTYALGDLYKGWHR